MVSYSRNVNIVYCSHSIGICDLSQTFDYRGASTSGGPQLTGRASFKKENNDYREIAEIRKSLCLILLYSKVTVKSLQILKNEHFIFVPSFVAEVNFDTAKNDLSEVQMTILAILKNR